MLAGDPKHHKEAKYESIQEISTRGMGLQIPYCVVSEVPF